MTKNEIAAILHDIALLLELKGENPFKCRAYLSGARAIENLDEDIGRLIEEDRLREVAGIGQALAEKIGELHREGRLEYYEALKASVPAGMLEMLEIPGLGAKKIIALNRHLGICSIAELTRACEEGRIAGLPGFGVKTQEKLLAGIRNRESYGKRHLWWEAAAIAEPILAGLRQLAPVTRAETAGSLRRGVETVGDLDFVAASESPAPVMDWFCALPGVAEVTGRGETKASVRFSNGLQADLRIVPDSQFVFALHHFTGSKDHNIQMRQRALERGWSLSEWGIARPEAAALAAEAPKTEARKPAAAPGSQAPAVPQIHSEADLFRFFGLHDIPPELREGLGEIEAAEAKPFPELVAQSDIRGVFHNHTTASDGHATLAEMADAAVKLGWEYLGIADHSKASFQAKGLDERRLERQIGEIRALNESGRFPLRLFSGVECDILPNGTLDFDEDILRRLDYVVVSVHSVFTQSETEMTARIIRAIEHPCTTMLGHLTGRLLLARPGYAVNAEKVIDAALANGVIIELNAHPRRLDMDWRLWRRSADRGRLLCSINPDAHSTEGLLHYRAGVVAARKGGLAPERVFNTWPLAKVESFLERSRQRA